MNFYEKAVLDNFFIIETGPLIQEADVDALERELPCALPSVYRRFLLGHNGGLLLRNTIDVPGAPWTPTNVYALFGLNRGLDTSDIRWNKEIFLNQALPSALLPVACDSGGNPFCMSMNAGRIGGIIYVDLDGHDATYHVADSFSEFLSKIRFSGWPD